MHTLALHLPGDAEGIEHALDMLHGNPAVIAVYRDGDSYREWGEDRRDDDPEHIEVVVQAGAAEILAYDLRKRGIPVDVTLTWDWSARVVWGFADDSGWASRYR